MDTKLLLVKCITILYLQSKLKETENTSVNYIINQVLSVVKPADKSISTDYGHDTLTALRDTVVWMQLNVANEFDDNSLKQRFILNVKDDMYILDALNQMFIGEDISSSDINKMISSQCREVSTWIDKNTVTDIIKDYYRKTQFDNDKLDWSTLIVDLQTKLEPFMHIGTRGKKATSHASISAVLDMDSPVEVARTLNMAQDQLSTAGVIKTPYQGINRMMGEPGGMRRGEFIITPALQHKNKSGQSVDWFCGASMFNKPYMMDPSKKPLNLRISFENEMRDDIRSIYERIWFNTEHTNINFSEVDTEEAARYIGEKLGVNGYSNKILRIDPTDYTYMDLFSLIEELEDEGYEIHFLSLDYLNMISKKGCNQGPQGEEIRDLIRRVRNFTSKKNITCQTPHQLSTDAKMLERTGPDNFLKHVVGRGYYDGCKRIDQEVDLEVYIHIGEVNGEFYQILSRGKHRGINRTPVANQSCVYKFDPIFGLPWDINGPDQSRRTLGGDTLASGGAPAWYNSSAT